MKLYESLTESVANRKELFRVKTPERKQREIEGKKDSMRNREGEKSSSTGFESS